MTIRRRLVQIGEITVRRTVAAPSSAAPRVHTSWCCRVFTRRRADEVARGAEIWSPSELSTMADLMRRAG